MRRRGTLRPVALLFAGLLAWSCSAHVHEGATDAVGGDEAAPSAVELRGDLGERTQRIQTREQEPSQRENDLQEARAEAEQRRVRDSAARERIAKLAGSGDGRTSPAPSDGRAGASVDARGVGRGPGPAEAAVDREPGASAASDTTVPNRGSPTLIAELRRRLIAEQQRRATLERDLNTLRQETSAGPFENRLDRDLREAKKQIEHLKEALDQERQARRDLALRYEQLQVQLSQMQAAQPVAPDRSDSEEVAALKERQRRALEGVERELLLSRQREQALRDALETGQGPDAAPLAVAVSDLKAENDALQARVDDEHRRNRQLSAKLDVAMRVTDLIFKMQNAGEATAP